MKDEKRKSKGKQMIDDMLANGPKKSPKPGGHGKTGPDPMPPGGGAKEPVLRGKGKIGGKAPRVAGPKEPGQGNTGKVPGNGNKSTSPGSKYNAPGAQYKRNQAANKKSAPRGGLMMVDSQGKKSPIQANYDAGPASSVMQNIQKKKSAPAPKPAENKRPKAKGPDYSNKYNGKVKNAVKLEKGKGGGYTSKELPGGKKTKGVY